MLHVTTSEVKQRLGQYIGSSRFRGVATTCSIR